MAKNKEFHFVSKSSLGDLNMKITEVIYLTDHDLLIRFSGGDVRICDMSQFFEPLLSRQYYSLPEFKNYTYTEHHITWGNESYSIDANILFECSSPYRDVVSGFKNKHHAVKKHSKSVTNEYSFDFSNVDFITGEGSQLEFSSVEEMDAYLDAYIKEEDKFRTAHPGVWIHGDDNDEIFEFSSLCHDFTGSISDINTKFIDSLLQQINSGSSLDVLCEAFKEFQSAINMQYGSLILIQERLNCSLSTLNKLLPTPKRDPNTCAISINGALSDLDKKLWILQLYGKRCNDLTGKTESPYKEIYQSFLSFIEKCFELTQIVDHCKICIENLLNVWLPNGALSDILQDFQCKSWDEDIPLIVGVQYLHGYDFLISFSNGEDRICDLTDSFNLPITIRYSVKFLKFPSFDSVSVWWGDRNREDCMEIGHDSLYKFSLPNC